MGQVLVGRRHCQRGHPPTDLVGDPQRLPAGGEELHLRAVSEQCVGQVGAGRDEVFAVVEEECALRVDVVQQLRQDVLAARDLCTPRSFARPWPVLSTGPNQASGHDECAGAAP